MPELMAAGVSCFKIEGEHLLLVLQSTGAGGVLGSVSGVGWVWESYTQLASLFCSDGRATGSLCFLRSPEGLRIRQLYHTLTVPYYPAIGSKDAHMASTFRSSATCMLAPAGRLKGPEYVSLTTRSPSWPTLP